MATFDGFDATRVCPESECAPNIYSSAAAVDLRWSGPATLTVDLGARDWTAFDVISFRVAVDGWQDPAQTPVDIEVVLTDASGTSAATHAPEHSTALARTSDPHATAGGFSVGTSKRALQAVRIPLSAFDVDVAHVTTLTLTFEGEGRAFVTDILAQDEPNVV